MNIRKVYDFSEYPENSTYHNKENKRVVGKIKGECKGRTNGDGAFIRPKMYSYQVVCGIEIGKAKDVSRTTIKKDLRYELYKECIGNDKQFKHKQVYIWRYNHKMGVFEQKKTCLNPFDSKKWIVPNLIDSRSYGHYQIIADGSIFAGGFLIDKDGF